MDHLDCKNIIIDVDGVLTDNKVWYDHNGERSKGFNSSDIWAIRELISRGYRVILVSASSWPGMEFYTKRTGAEFISTREKGSIGIDDYVCIVNDVWDFGIAKKAKRVYYPVDAFDGLKKQFPNAIKIDCKGGEGVIAKFISFLIQPPIV